MSRKNPFRVFEKQIVDTDKGYVFSYFFWKIYDLFCSSINFVGIPDYIPKWFIMKVLFWDGRGLMAYDEEVDRFLFTKMNLNGMPDVYNIPTNRQSYAVNGYLEDFYKDNSVIFWDNYSMYPFANKAYMYAELLQSIWETRNQNLRLQFTPRVIVAPDSQKLTYELISKQYDQRIPVIRVNDSIDVKNVNVLNLEVPYIADKMEQELRAVWSQVLCDIGYESNPIEKKERLVSSETGNNNGEIEGMRNTRVDSINRALIDCNKLWGWNSRAEFNSNLPTQVNLGLDFEQIGNKNGGMSSEPLDTTGK